MNYLPPSFPPGRQFLCVSTPIHPIPPPRMAASFHAARGIFSCCQSSLRPSLSLVSFPSLHSVRRCPISRHFDSNRFTLVSPFYSDYSLLLTQEQGSNTCTHVQASNTASVQTSNIESSVHQDPDKWTIKMLYDGDCPLCMREVNMLRERNMRYGTIKFVDISSNDYIAEENEGIDFATAMGRIHAILWDGTVLTDINAFKRLYEEVGLGWVYAFTKIKSIAKIADFVYAVWAQYRLPITGRPSLDQILKEREEKINGGCSSGQCGIE